MKLDSPEGQKLMAVLKDAVVGTEVLDLKLPSLLPKLSSEPVSAILLEVGEKYWQFGLLWNAINCGTVVIELHAGSFRFEEL